MMATYTHIPVLRDRIVDLLAPALVEDGALVIDGTVGLGGHAEALLAAFPTLRLLGIDRDPDALQLTAGRLEPFGDRVRLVQARFDDMADAARTHFPGIAPRGILLDLGVSSMQLDNVDRGFSYLSDAELDMRMNPDDPVSARDILATWSAAELAALFRRYGDEPLAKRYADAIVSSRMKNPIDTADQLVGILDRATPRSRQTRGHVAKRVFQALRIEVNSELEAIERALPIALDMLAPGGRIVVLSYQSAEDRLVKHAIDQRTRSQSPVDLPIEVAKDRPTFSWLVKREGASEDEIASNPRSQSVRLRAAVKLGDS
jgi:16S rRNA (cytosine1402-N4)-methyltransferase